MAIITQKKLEDLIRNAPPGTSRQNIISELRKRGHTLKFERGRIEPAKPTTNFLQFALRDIGRGASPQESRGFFRRAFQTTIGSKALAGVAQLPGRVAETQIRAGEAESLAETRKRQSEKTAELIKIRRDLEKGSPEYQRMSRMINSSLDIMEGVRRAEEEVTPPERMETAREAMGRTLGAEVAAGTSAIPSPTSLMGRIGVGGAIGGSMSLSEALLDENLPPKDVVKETGTGALLGAAIAPFTFLAEKVSKKVGKNLYRQLTKYSNAPNRKARKLVRDKMTGTLKSIGSKLDDEISVFEKKLTPLLGKSKKTITGKEIVERALNIKKRKRPQIARLIDEESFVDDVNGALGKISNYKIGPDDTLTMTETNEMRRVIDGKLRDRDFYKIFKELPNAKQNLMLVRKAMSETVKQKVPEAVSLFSDIAPTVSARSAISYTQYRVSKLMPLTWFDLLGVGSFAVEPKVGSVMLAPMVGKHLIRNGLIPSYGGATALRLSDAMTKLFSDPKALMIMQRVIRDIETQE